MTSTETRRPGVPTSSSALPAEPGPAAPPAPRRRRRASTAARRPVAAIGATLLIAASIGGGPLAAVGSAQQSGGMFNQSTPAQQTQQTVQKSNGGGGAPGTSELNAPATFDGPGIDKGTKLIGWAKAGALIIGTLTLIIGIPMSKALKEAGNHHASGVRAGAMGVGGAIFLAGIAGTALPWLMA